MSSFYGLSVALSGLTAARTVMDVIANNVANANTDGYSRQRATLSSLSSINAEAGGGVEVSSINRAYSATTAAQLRESVNALSEYGIKEELFSQIETLLGEPGSDGLSSLIDSFFSSLSELSSSPESSVVRAQVKQNARTLCDYFNELSADLTSLAEDIDNNIREIVTEVNSLLSQIRDVNDLISGASASGDSPNTLLDQRDALLEQLSSFVDIDVSEKTDGTVNVYIGGNVVVQGEVLRELAVVDDTDNYNYAAIKLADDLDGDDVMVTGGELKGLLDMRDSDEFGVTYYKEQLDELSYSIVDAVNTQHQAGYGLDGVGGRDFFAAVSLENAAANMSLSSDILDATDGLDRIAASSTAAGVPGDGSNALSLSQLQDEDGIGDSTFNEFYTTLLSTLGVFSEVETSKVGNQEALQSQLESIRDSISGVSLDEEAANLIIYQNMYNAASQIIQVMNENYQTLIELME